MSHYYDEKTTRCEACGWFGTGVYPRGEKTGQTYERCEWYAYIFHKTTDEPCKDFKTPRAAQEYLSQQEKRNKSRKR